MKEMWTANIVVILDDEVRSFGNLGGLIFDNEKDAWNACLKDLNAMKKKYPKSSFFVNQNCYHIELTSKDEDVFICWEIQRMFENVVVNRKKKAK